jgi:hypothetical protein
MSRIALAASLVAVLALAACNAAPAAPSRSPSVVPDRPSTPPSASPVVATPRPTDPETPVATAGPSGLDYTAGERYLQDGIRRGAVDCAPAAGSDEMPGAAIAGIECYSDDPSLARLGFYLFDSDADMLDAYRFEMSAEGVAFDSGTCHDGEHEGAYTPGDGFVPSRQGCFMDDEGRANYRAILPGDHVYVSVLSGRDDMSYVQDFAWLGNQDTPGRPTLWAAPR